MELALVAVSVAACLGLSRLFADGSFLLRCLAVLLAHGLAALCRRRQLGALATTLVVGVAAVLVTTVTLYGFVAVGTARSEVIRVLSEDMEDAWSLFLDVKPPAPTERGSS